jgi:hypothetical protein
MSALSTLAKMLGLADENAADDAMRSERVYRATLSRRSLLAAAGALAAGTVMVPGSELVAPHPLHDWRDTGHMSAAIMYMATMAHGQFNLAISRRFVKVPSW